LDRRLPPGFKEFLRLLGSHEGEYLLIGGCAVGYSGYPRATQDMTERPATAAPIFREETGPMANIDDQTRRMLVQNSELTRQRIENSGRSRLDAIMDICAKPDIVWAVWSNGQDVVKGQKLVAEGAAKTSWIAIACADKAEADDLERKLG